jgi:iron only hydrogenase large subunit-like protein
MTKILHAFDIIEDKCKAKLACMKVCPTHAIRVRDGKARVNPPLCIDCGECIVACPEGAIIPKTDTLEAIRQFRYKVAIPSPTLFGQFPMDITPSNIIDGLLAIGFDAVYDISLESELINMAIRDYLDDYQGPYPLFSSACPVVVRLIQVAYPDMAAQIIPIEPPRELASREMKRLYSEALGFSPAEIGAVYIAPCPAKVVAIKQPAEEVKSYLDLGVGISVIYNRLLTAMTQLKRENTPKAMDREQDPAVKSAISLAWSFRGGQCQSLKPSRYISVSQLRNVIRILDDVEKGKLKGIEFVESYACTGGCIGGPLTVDDMFVSRSKMQKTIELIGDAPQYVKDEVRKRYVKGDYNIRQPIRPRPIETGAFSIDDKIRRIRIREELLEVLPGLDCGFCGAPTCETFATDVAAGSARRDECIFLSDKRIDALRERYRFKGRRPDEAPE